MDESLNLLRRTFRLASYGLGYVDALPLVGWLIAEGFRVIAEGWLTQEDLETAIRRSASSLQTQDVTLYLNEDPRIIKDVTQCCVWLMSMGIKHVILPFASQETRSAFQNSGIVVECLETTRAEAEDVNIRYHTSQRLRRPYIVLKWAQTADGFIARSNYDSKWISGVLARKLVHQWRAQEQAIMVGTQTYQYDNPRLNVRDWQGRDPVRVVLDRHRRLSPLLHAFDGSQPTLCYNLTEQSRQHNLEFIAVRSNTPEQFLAHVMHDLVARNLYSLFVEGGSQLLSQLLQQGWWDEARVFQSAQHFGEGIPAPSLTKHRLMHITEVAEDKLLHYQNINKK